MGSGPLGDGVAFLIRKTSDNHHDEINESPDAQAAKSEDLQDTGFDLAYVEAVNSQNAEEEAKKKGWKYSLLAHLILLERLVGCRAALS
jgi:hypothetical protein